MQKNSENRIRELIIRFHNFCDKRKGIIAPDSVKRLTTAYQNCFNVYFLSPRTYHCHPALVAGSGLEIIKIHYKFFK
ncbi:MAG: hypothetical protein ABI597_13170, partial [Gammaproteobacteria bacterium]